jgi:Uncharacterised conserved protein
MANVLDTCSDRNVIIQLLQTATLLAHNLVKENHKNYLLSSKFFSEIVSYPFDFTDEEIVENYMSYLKGLAINISKPQIINFLVTKHFSLFAGAMMFFNYKETLIKTASRTVILTVIKRILYIVNHKVINEYIVDSGFFFSLVNNLRHQISIIEELSASKINENKIETLVNQIIDNLYYMNDIFEQDLPEFTNKLTSYFILTIFPVVFSPIYLKLSEGISQNLSLTVLYHIISIINSPTLVNSIVTLLLSPSISSQLLKICLSDPPNSPPNVLIDYEITEPNMISKSILEILNHNSTEFKENQATLVLMIFQSILSNQSISKDILSAIGMLSSRYNKKQKLLNGILGETSSLTNDYNQEIVSKILDLISCSINYNFYVCHLSCKVLFELTCVSNPRIKPEHEDMLKHSLYILNLKFQNLFNTELFDAIVELFDEEWDYTKKINFNSNVVCNDYIYLLYGNNVPLNIISRKKSIETNQRPPKSHEIIQKDLKVFFLIRKLWILINLDDIEEYPLMYTNQADWKINSYVDVSNFYIANILYDKVFTSDKKVLLLPEIENFFILLEPDSYRPAQAKVFLLEKLKNIKIHADFTTSLITLTSKGKKSLNFSPSVQGKNELQILYSKLGQRINFAYSFECEMIKSFFEDSPIKYS